MTNSTATARPPKPRADFPLFPHRNGSWAKKVRGKAYYFGLWADDPRGAAAEQLWAEQKDDLLAGRVPRAKRDGLTVMDLCNRFLTAKEQQRDSGELSPRSFADYRATAQLIIDEFGKLRLVEDLAADDFRTLRRKCAKRWGVHRLSSAVQMVRTIFKFAYDDELIAKPVRFGADFKKPTSRSMREHKQRQRQTHGPRMFSASEIRSILAAATQPMRAMVLLAINRGFGNNDCGLLPLSALDLKNVWIDFARPKTAVDRHSPLWPETIEALREAIKFRPEPADEEFAGAVFLTRRGLPWAKDIADSPITKEFAKILTRIDAANVKEAKRAGQEPPPKIRRKGCNFYALRHSFETVAGGAKDQVAADRLMGHVDTGMAANYREDIDGRPIEAERLIAVTNHVRAWLWPSPTVEGGAV